MSDQWEFYPCQMGEHQAFIFYDHGIRDEIDGLTHVDSLKVRLKFRNPTEAGLPTNEEFQELSALEDRLGTAVQQMGGVYVGRVTVDGARYFHCFVSFGADMAERLLNELSQTSGYRLEFHLEPDPEKNAYWEQLFPDSDEWRVIQDMKVLDQLKQHGDDWSVERRVDHWCYFPGPAQRDEFSRWAVTAGYTVECLSEPEGDDRDYGIQIFHECRTDLGTITAATQILQHTAEECGGNYDGWETRVEAKPPVPSNDKAN